MSYVEKGMDLKLKNSLNTGNFTTVMRDIIMSLGITGYYRLTGNSKLPVTIYTILP